MTALSPLLRGYATDEYVSPPAPARTVRAAWEAAASVEAMAERAGRPPEEMAQQRRATAVSLRALDAAWGGGFFVVPEEAVHDDEAAWAAFGGDAPVVDVQTHLVDAGRWRGASAAAVGGFLQMVDPERWAGGVDPAKIDAAMWASLVFGSSTTAMALLTSTPGLEADNVLTNPQIAAAREVVERYGPGRVLTHTIVHPNYGPQVLDDMARWHDELRPSGWKCYTLYGPPTAAAPGGGWFLDDEEVGLPFLEQVRTLGPRLVATHKGLGGPVPDVSIPTASPRDIGPAARLFADITFVVYHSGYETNPHGQEGAYDPVHPEGVDRLVASLEQAGIGPGANVYAELGSTWYLMLRRPPEAAHVLGKLLRAVGPERILWGTDSIWYGSPQPLIDAFRAFEIPEWMQAEFGYPALTPAVKEQILHANARRAYTISDAAFGAAVADTNRTWVPDAAAELRRRLTTV